MPPDVSILALAVLAATGNAARVVGHAAIGNLLHLDVGRSIALARFSVSTACHRNGARMPAFADAFGGADSTGQRNTF